MPDLSGSRRYSVTIMDGPSAPTLRVGTTARMVRLVEIRVVGILVWITYGYNCKELASVKRKYYGEPGLSNALESAPTCAATVHQRGLKTIDHMRMAKYAYIEPKNAIMEIEKHSIAPLCLPP